MEPRLWRPLTSYLAWSAVAGRGGARAELLDNLTKNPQLPKDNMTMGAIHLLDEENKEAFRYLAFKLHNAKEDAKST